MAGIMFITGGGIGKQTETAGTRIRRTLGGVGSKYTHLTNIRVTTGATAHTLTVMRTASRAKVATALAATGTALVVDAALTDGAGNAPAANDVLAVRLDNGEWHWSTISAWDAGTKTATLGTAIPTGRSAPVGAKVAFYGVQGDSFHSGYQFALASGGTNQFPAVSIDGGSLVRNTGPGEPLLLDIDNATNASTVENANFGCTQS